MSREAVILRYSEGSRRRATFDFKILRGVPLRMTVLAVLGCMAASCKSAVQSGQNTALSGVDLVKMTDDMAMKLGSDPEVQRAIREHGPLKIVVTPVENRMR